MTFDDFGVTDDELKGVIQPAPAKPFQYTNQKTLTAFNADQWETRHGVKIILMLADDHGTSYRKFFQTQRVNKRNRIVTAKDGDLAKLYRLTLGKEAGHRLRNSMIMARALIGYKFIASTKAETDKSTGEIYFKANNLEPTNPVLTELWTATGATKSKIKRPKTNPDLTQNLPKIDPNLTRDHVAQTPINTWAGEQSESDIRCQILEEQIPDTSLTLLEKYKVKNNMSGYDFKQMPNETNDQYYERVLDATF